MSSRGKRERIGIILGAAAVAATSTMARAGLNVDLRIISSSPSVVVTDNKHFIPTTVGDSVTLALFAQVSGTNGVHDEQVQDVSGLLSSMGSVKGDFSGGVVAPFTGNGSTNGSVQDFDSDGDLDIGSLGTSATGKFFARSTNPTSASTPVDAETGEVQVGQFTWVYTGGNPGDGSTLNFIRRTPGTLGPGTWGVVWFEDGGVSKTGGTGPCSLGSP